MSTAKAVSTPRAGARIWPVAVHAPVVAFLSLAVLVTDDRAQTWTRLSEALLELAGLPLSFAVSAVIFLVVSPLLNQMPALVEWLVVAVLIACAWVNVAAVAWLTRRGVPARPLIEAAAMLVAGVGIWAALLSWAPEADYALLPSAGAAVAVLVTVFCVASRRPPVLSGALVGGGAYLAVCTHVALNSSFVLFLAIPLAVLGGAAVVVAAATGSALGRWRAASRSER